MVFPKDEVLRPWCAEPELNLPMEAWHKKEQRLHHVVFSNPVTQRRRLGKPSEPRLRRLDNAKIVNPESYSHFRMLSTSVKFYSRLTPTIPVGVPFRVKSYDRCDSMGSIFHRTYLVSMFLHDPIMRPEPFLMQTTQSKELREFADYLLQHPEGTEHQDDDEYWDGPMWQRTNYAFQASDGERLYLARHGEQYYDVSLALGKNARLSMCRTPRWTVEQMAALTGHFRTQYFQAFMRSVRENFDVVADRQQSLLIKQYESHESYGNLNELCERMGEKNTVHINPAQYWKIGHPDFLELVFGEKRPMYISLKKKRRSIDKHSKKNNT